MKYAPMETERRMTDGIWLSVVLFLFFFTLKITGFLDWSWWWVTCPLWFWPALLMLMPLYILGVIVVMLLFALLMMLALWLFDCWTTFWSRINTRDPEPRIPNCYKH